jgi:hypothetical protein
MDFNCRQLHGKVSCSHLVYPLIAVKYRKMNDGSRPALAVLSARLRQRVNAGPARRGEEAVEGRVQELQLSPCLSDEGKGCAHLCSAAT